MLQPKEISKILSQVLAENQTEASTRANIVACLLLSPQGIPLTTVSVAGLIDTRPELNGDNLRVYSLVAVASLEQQQNSDDPDFDDWAAVDLDGSLRAMVKKFETCKISETHRNYMYVAVFYLAGSLDGAVKLKLNAVAGALAKGLSGYVSP